MLNNHCGFFNFCLKNSELWAINQKSLLYWHLLQVQSLTTFVREIKFKTVISIFVEVLSVLLEFA